MAIDATAAFFEKEIAEARAALIAEARAAPDQWWPAWELKTKARNGWSDGAMNLALNRLIEDGTLTVEGGLVRLTS